MERFNQEAIIKKRVLDSVSGAFGYNYIRSSGRGGQNVNKVATKVQLIFNIDKSSFTQKEKEIIFKKLKNRINKKNELILESDQARSQIKNKEDAEKRLLNLLAMALTPAKIRVKTKVPKKENQKRLRDKKLRSLKKSFRKGDDLPA